MEISESELKYIIKKAVDKARTLGDAPVARQLTANPEPSPKPDVKVKDNVSVNKKPVVEKPSDLVHDASSQISKIQSDPSIDRHEAASKIHETIRSASPTDFKHLATHLGVKSTDHLDAARELADRRDIHDPEQHPHNKPHTAHSAADVIRSVVGKAGKHTPEDIAHISHITANLDPSHHEKLGKILGKTPEQVKQNVDAAKQFVDQHRKDKAENYYKDIGESAAKLSQPSNVQVGEQKLPGTKIGQFGVVEKPEGQGFSIAANGKELASVPDEKTALERAAMLHHHGVDPNDSQQLKLFNDFHSNREQPDMSGFKWNPIPQSSPQNTEIQPESDMSGEEVPEEKDTSIPYNDQPKGTPQLISEEEVRQNSTNNTQEETTGSELDQPSNETSVDNDKSRQNVATDLFDSKFQEPEESIQEPIPETTETPVSKPEVTDKPIQESKPDAPKKKRGRPKKVKDSKEQEIIDYIEHAKDNGDLEGVRHFTDMLNEHIDARGNADIEPVPEDESVKPDVPKQEVEKPQVEQPIQEKPKEPSKIGRPIGPEKSHSGHGDVPKRVKFHDGEYKGMTATVEGQIPKRYSKENTTYRLKVDGTKPGGWDGNITQTHDALMKHATHNDDSEPSPIQETKEQEKKPEIVNQPSSEPKPLSARERMMAKVGKTVDKTKVDQGVSIGKEDIPVEPEVKEVDPKIAEKEKTRQETARLTAEEKAKYHQLATDYHAAEKSGKEDEFLGKMDEESRKKLANFMDVRSGDGDPVHRKRLDRIRGINNPDTINVAPEKKVGRANQPLPPGQKPIPYKASGNDKSDAAQVISSIIEHGPQLTGDDLEETTYDASDNEDVSKLEDEQDKKMAEIRDIKKQMVGITDPESEEFKSLKVKHDELKSQYEKLDDEIDKVLGVVSTGKYKKPEKKQEEPTTDASTEKPKKKKDSEGESKGSVAGEEVPRDPKTNERLTSDRYAKTIMDAMDSQHGFDDDDFDKSSMTKDEKKKYKQLEDAAYQDTADDDDKVSIAAKISKLESDGGELLKEYREALKGSKGEQFLNDLDDRRRKKLEKINSEMSKLLIEKNEAAKKFIEFTKELHKKYPKKSKED